MDNKAIKEILLRYSTGKCTEEEKAWVETWYIRYKPDSPDLPPEEMERDLQEILDNLPGKRRVRRMAVWLRVAAVFAFLAVSAGLYVYLSKPAGSPTPAGASVKNDLSPGGNKALLTLGDGSTIVLEEVDDGVLAQQENAVIRKMEGGRLEYQLAAPIATGGRQPVEKPVVYHTLSTPRGGQYKLILPDGSRVWLNAASSIRYPAAFTGDERTVEIRGEAYFEIAPLTLPGTGRKVPFTVRAAGLEVEVLGTHFNINAYEDEPAVKTTLLEGSVLVSSKQTLPAGRPASRTGRQEAQSPKLLKPGQQVSVDRNTGNFHIKEVDADEAVAWKEGFFQFHRSGLPAVMRQLSRWYDAEVSYEGAIPERAFGGKIPRDANLSEVLKILEFSNVHFRIETPPEGPDKIIVIH